MHEKASNHGYSTCTTHTRVYRTLVTHIARTHRERITVGKYQLVVVCIVKVKKSYMVRYTYIHMVPYVVVEVHVEEISSVVCISCIIGTVQ